MCLVFFFLFVWVSTLLLGVILIGRDAHRRRIWVLAHVVAIFAAFTLIDAAQNGITNRKLVRSNAAIGHVQVGVLVYRFSNAKVEALLGFTIPKAAEVRLAMWHIIIRNMNRERRVLFAFIGWECASVGCQCVFDLVQEAVGLFLWTSSFHRQCWTLTLGGTHLLLSCIVLILGLDAVVVLHLIELIPIAETLVQKDSTFQHWWNLLMLNNINLLAYLLWIIFGSIFRIFI